MITSLRASFIRLAAGGGLALLGLGTFLFALPSASQRRERSERGAREATAGLQALQEDLKGYRDQAERVRAGRSTLDQVLASMPAESVGRLHWRLSQRVFELAGQHEVRLLTVKYGAPSREGAKGSPLEALDVEFTVAGVFEHLKAFMLALEGSRLPFAVVSAKLDESPDGAHLNVVLRAFRQAPDGARDSGDGEGA